MPIEGVTTSGMSISSMIQSSAIAAVISDPRLPDNPIVECNDAFLLLTGYPREDVIGRNCRFLRGPDTEPWLTETLRTGIAAQQPTMVEILNYKKDRTPFRNAVLVAPIFDTFGKLEYFLGSQVEISEDAALAAEDRRVAARQRIASLTPRQREIVIHLASGKMNKQIAFALGIGERMVKMHRSAVLQALGLKTTADVIRLAIEAGY